MKSKYLSAILVSIGVSALSACATTPDGEPCTNWTSNPRYGRGRPAPAYPQEARRDGVTGFVHLRYRVDQDGRTHDIEVVDSRPRGVFEAAAIEAVENTRYCSGPPTSDPIEVRIGFDL